jgi:hypothetical protein
VFETNRSHRIGCYFNCARYIVQGNRMWIVSSGGNNGIGQHTNITTGIGTFVYWSNTNSAINNRRSVFVQPLWEFLCSPPLIEPARSV